jgi:hypothetical protein
MKECSSSSCDRDINYAYAYVGSKGTYCSQLCLSQTEHSDNFLKEKEVSKSVYATGVQIAGNHYSSMEIQPVKYITANKLTYLQGNVIKYISRYKSKNGAEDLKKAKHYIDLILELEYGE